MSKKSENNMGFADVHQKLQLLIINTKEPCVIINTDFKIACFNEQFKNQYFNYFGIEVLPGTSIFNYAQAHSIEKLKEIYQQVFTGKIKETELQVTLADNSVRTFLNKYKPALDENKAIVGAFVSSFDITEKISLQKLRVTAEKRFQALIENAGEIISLTDKEGNVLYVSPSIEKITGYAPHEIINKTCFLRMAPDQVDESKKVLKYVLQNPGIPVSRINRFLHKNGYSIWMEGTVINLLNDINVAAIVSNYRDVTERIASEKKLKESENNLRAIFNSSVEAFLLVDDKCVIKAFNEKAKNNYRFAPKELTIGANLLEYIEEKRQAYFKEYVTRVLNGETIEYDTNYIDEENNISKWFHATLSPVKEDDVIKGICITRRDISKRKKVEEELKLSKEKYKLLSEELANSNSELEQFTYMASHDLQEPLRMITGFLTQLEIQYKNQLDERAQEYIYFATDGAVRMRKMILDLLQYSVAGKKNLETEQVNINDLLQEVMRLNRKIIEEKEAIIEWDNLPVIKSNRASLQQVFQNLIGNALKYQSADKKPLIKINAIETKTHWQFSFSDNGIGIEPEFFEKIFVVFQRLHTKDEYSGTGLGLAISKKIIDIHGGEIWVESDLNKGSTFYFTIVK